MASKMAAENAEISQFVSYRHQMMQLPPLTCLSLQWRHNERDGVSIHRRLDYCYCVSFVQAQLKETSKLRVTGICGDRWIPLTKGK